MSAAVWEHLELIHKASIIFVTDASSFYFQYDNVLRELIVIFALLGETLATANLKIKLLHIHSWGLYIIAVLPFWCFRINFLYCNWSLNIHVDGSKALACSLFFLSSNIDEMELNSLFVGQNTIPAHLNGKGSEGGQLIMFEDRVLYSFFSFTRWWWQR